MELSVKEIQKQTYNMVCQNSLCRMVIFCWLGFYYWCISFYKMHTSAISTYSFYFLRTANSDTQIANSNRLLWKNKLKVIWNIPVLYCSLRSKPKYLKPIFVPACVSFCKTDVDITTMAIKLSGELLKQLYKISECQKQ